MPQRMQLHGCDLARGQNEVNCEFTICMPFIAKYPVHNVSTLPDVYIRKCYAYCTMISRRECTRYIDRHVF